MGTYNAIFFIKMTPILWRHVRTGRSQLVQYFAHSFTTCQVLNTTASYECVQQWYLFKCQTSSFYFSTCCPNLFEHLLIHAGQTVWETRLLRSLDQSLKQHIGEVFLSTTFSRPQAKFLHQTCVDGLAKHLSPYTGRISVWMVFEQSLCPEIGLSERCSLWDAFSGSVAIFIFTRWRHSDAIVIKFSCYSELNLVQNLYFGVFIFWNRIIVPFCNLFIGRPSYLEFWVKLTPFLRKCRNHNT